MRPSTRRAGALSMLVAVALLLAVLPAAVAPAPATAKAKRRPPVPAPGFVVDRAWFEPLDASGLQVAAKGPYRGAIEVLRSPSGGLAAINHVPFEDYMLGISEVPLSWPAEAQKAQAIAARTYVLHEMGRKVATAYRLAGADICASDACQVYTGLETERRPGSEAWVRAVQATEGQVLHYKGKPILAKYSSSNGGRTVAGGKPYLRSVDDPDDRQSPLHRWRASYPLSEVGRVLGLRATPHDVHTSGDEVVIKLVDGDGNPAEQRLAAPEFRTRINASLPAPDGLPLVIPSNRFGVGTYEGAVVVEGRGFGHGIGLSQFGSLGKARRGLKAADILAAYYGGLRPVKVPADKLPALVRVAIVLGGTATTVAGEGGAFRITDGTGAVVAHAATGRWSASPGPRGRGLRLVPPPEQFEPATAGVTAFEPPVPVSGRPIAMHLVLSGPTALTRVHLSSPDGTVAEVVPPTLRPAGELVVTLAPSAMAGQYTVVIERDAGAGRTTSSTVAVGVAPSAAAPPGLATAATAPGGTDLPESVIRAAVVSLVLGLLSLVSALGRRRRPGSA